MGSMMTVALKARRRKVLRKNSLMFLLPVLWCPCWRSLRNIRARWPPRSTRPTTTSASNCSERSSVCCLTLSLLSLVSWFWGLWCLFDWFFLEVAGVAYLPWNYFSAVTHCTKTNIKKFKNCTYTLVLVVVGWLFFNFLAVVVLDPHWIKGGGVVKR